MFRETIIPIYNNTIAAMKKMSIFTFIFRNSVIIFCLINDKIKLKMKSTNLPTNQLKLKIIYLSRYIYVDKYTVYLR